MSSENFNESGDLRAIRTATETLAAGGGGDASAANQVALNDRIGEVQATPTANTVLARLKTIATSLSNLEGFNDGIEALLTTLNTYIDGLETLGTSTNTLLTTQAGYVDGLEALATLLNGYVDGLEASATSTNTKLDTLHTDIATTLAAYVDGIEGLITSTNGYVDGLEGILGTTAGAAVITDANGTVQQYLRGLIVNGLLGNTSLASILTSVDGLEGVLGTTAGAAVITDANGTAQQYLRGLIVLTLLQNTYLDGVEGSLTSINTNTAALANDTEYEAVAASTTDQPLGATGATGDYLSHITVFPTSISPGVVTVKDNTTVVASFAGGVSSLSNIEPFTIVLGGKSRNGAWTVTTGASVSIVAFGDFT